MFHHAFTLNIAQVRYLHSYRHPHNCILPSVQRLANVGPLWLGRLGARLESFHAIPQAICTTTTSFIVTSNQRISCSKTGIQMYLGCDCTAELPEKFPERNAWTAWKETGRRRTQIQIQNDWDTCKVMKNDVKVM